MSTAPFAVCCKSCGYIEDKAYDPEKGTPYEPVKPLTLRGHVPMYCPKCGQRSWQVPATEEQIEKFNEAKRREARATELCRTLNIDGLLKIPDEVRMPAEVKNAISNLLAPLDGEVLERAQENCVKIARSGVQVPNDQWVDLFDKAVAKAKAIKKGAATT